MDGIILSSILSGTRIQPVSEALKMGVDQTEDLLGTSQFEPTNSVKPHLLIGEKVLNYNVFISKTTVGMLASSVSVSVDPHYSILNSRLLGTREGFSGVPLTASLPFVTQIVKSNTGVSTYGIGYTPVVSDTSTKSELRRWPRNWYGDNIKN